MAIQKKTMQKLYIFLHGPFSLFLLFLIQAAKIMEERENLKIKYFPNPYDYIRDILSLTFWYYL